MKNCFKYLMPISAAGIFMVSSYYYPAEIFLAFTAGWLLIIPAVFIVYMIHGFMTYRRERKHMIVVTIKPDDSIAGAEMELPIEEIYSGKGSGR